MFLIKEVGLVLVSRDSAAITLTSSPCMDSRKLNQEVQEAFKKNEK